ncbi:3-dehydroquinate synthase [Nocardioidaceae bacterium]|nr:3-dehydroquinate synthase [Nocardioidaceae bacterium]
MEPSAAVAHTSADAPVRVRVAGPAPYDVVIGHLGDRIADVLGDLLGGEVLGHRVTRVAVVSPDNSAVGAYVSRVRSALADRGLQVLDVTVPDGEAGKTADVAARAWEALGEAGFTRSDAVVTVGGGAVTDMGGFIAATWLRGVPVVHVPTTLLAMVDAAVGGKTGMNTGAGKNLVGAFHEPAGVVCDLDALVTLPRAELVAGMAEVLKCGFIADPRILELVEGGAGAAMDPLSPVVAELVRRAVQVKADVVAGDLRETGGADGHPGREALNYGHTLAHAIERASGYAVRHGEAVAIGMVFVAELARRAGRLDEETVARHRTVLEAVGLPTTYADHDYETLLAGMRVDKKARGATLRFVVLEGIGRPVVLTGPGEDDLRGAYEALSGLSGFPGLSGTG